MYFSIATLRINISKTKGVHCQSILLGRASTFVYFSYMKRIWAFLWKWANNFCYANNSFGLALPMNMQMKVNLVIRFREEMCCYLVYHQKALFTGWQTQPAGYFLGPFFISTSLPSPEVYCNPCSLLKCWTATFLLHPPSINWCTNIASKTVISGFQLDSTSATQMVVRMKVFDFVHP